MCYNVTESVTGDQWVTAVSPSIALSLVGAELCRGLPKRGGGTSTSLVPLFVYNLFASVLTTPAQQCPESQRPENPGWRGWALLGLGIG